MAQPARWSVPQSLDEALKEARTRADLLRQHLPHSVDATALGVQSKAPFLLLCTREALIWRMEELARSACHAFEQNDFAAAALLARAAVECAALAWMLMDVMGDREKLTPEALHETLARMLVGSRMRPEGPRALPIGSCIKRMDKKVSGVHESYGILSEIAHPNWRGVFGMYAKTDEPTFTAHFGHGLRSTDSTKGVIVNALLGALLSFEFAYNRISDEMSGFLAELESIWPDEKSAPADL